MNTSIKSKSYGDFPLNMQFYPVIFGANPNYQPHDITTNINATDARIIHADKDHKNTALIDVDNLPEGVKYVVLDAAQAIGTCYKFPCDPNNTAAGINGTLIVFYAGAKTDPKVVGNILLFGGRTNEVVTGGHLIEPIKILAPTLMPSVQSTGQPSSQSSGQPTETPSIQPTSQPSDFPTSQQNLMIQSHKKGFSTAEIASMVVGSTTFIAICACVTNYLKRSQKVYDKLPPSEEVSEPTAINVKEPKLVFSKI